MKCIYRITELTNYDEAVNDKELKGYTKEWFAILNNLSGLGIVKVNLDKRNYKKIHPLMLLYKFVLLKEVK